MLLELLIFIIINFIMILCSCCGTPYRGPSIQNILGNLVSVAVGFLLAAYLEMSGLGLVRFVWVIVSEMFCMIYMRDSLLLTISRPLLTIINIGTTRPYIRILSNWQEGGIPEGYVNQNRIWA